MSVRLIQRDEVEGCKAFGVPQYTYTVAGNSGQDLIEALTVACFKEATAIEVASQAYADLVKARQTKVDELANVMAVLARAIASMDPKSNNTDKKSDPDNELVDAKNTCNKYGISMYLTDGNRITYRNAQTCNNDVQYAMDKEDNDLQQDLVGLQSLMSKRDDQFSMAAKTVRKAYNAASSTVRNF